MPTPISRASQAGVADAPKPADRPPSAPLPIWRTVRHSYAFTLRHQRTLVRMALPWLVAALAVGYAGMRLGVAEPGWVAAGLVDGVGTSAVTVAWLRFASRGETVGWGAPLNRDVGSLVLRSFGVGLACLLPAMLLALGGSRLVASLIAGPPGQGLAFTLLALVGAGAGYAMIRLQPYVVAGALGHPQLTIGGAWRAMRGHTARLVAAYLLVIALALAAAVVGISLGAGVVAGLFDMPLADDVLKLPSEGGELEPAALIIEALVRTVGYGLASLNATMLATAVRHIMGPPPATTTGMSSVQESQKT